MWPRSLLRHPAALALCAVLSGAGAHGQEVADLRGLKLCVEPAAVRVTVEGIAPERAERARTRVERTLTASLDAAFARTGVRYERRAACPPGVGVARQDVFVRYLDPKHYLGFGDPAYSYSVRTAVHLLTLDRREEAWPLRFVAGYSEIHSERRTRRPFEEALVTWGEEQTRDLVLAWREDNPTFKERLASLGPLGWGGLGVGVGWALALLLLGRVRRRGPL